MNDLYEAWSELDRLESEEKAILQRLLHVHMEIKAHRTRIDALLRERPPAINRLPAELLPWIFGFCITDFKSPEKSMQRLAGVSRIWKDVILKTSRFWTSVKVVPSASLSFLRTHLKRTSQAPLHIYIEEWSVGIDHEISKILEAVLPTTKRWSTLCIDNNSVNFGRIVIHSLEHREFPALTKALLSLSLASSDFLAPAYAPALEDLSVRDVSLPFIDDLVSP